MSFKKEHTFEERRLEAEKIRVKHPDRIAIICEKVKNSHLPEIDRKKYLVPPDLTMGQFVYVVRKVPEKEVYASLSNILQRLQLPPEQAIFLFINGSMFPNATPMSLVYETKVDKDGFLYITYSGENTFG